jgi:nitrate reductase alpha subunit
VILFWGCNPIVTSIPNAHFFTEAKYNGSKIVCISPDYSPSAIKADLWVPLNPGTDAAHWRWPSPARSSRAVTSMKPS